jgi:hypothetical protein
MARRFVRLLWVCLIPVTIFAEDQPVETEEIQKLISIHGELKAHYRWSEDSRFPLRFPFPPEFIPRGQTQVFEQVVDPGSSFEVSNAALILDFTPGESVTGKVRVHFIDLYNRNPTSTDQTVNVKEAWLLFGKRTDFMKPAEGTSAYILFGKAPKFERQPDRNMESYGLIQTAYNRFEDLQLQLGGTFGSHIYWRAQVSNGNPVFFRDTNALAGDNGNDDLRLPNPELHLNSGFPILYDAEVEEVGFHKPEAGGGLGIRFQSESLDRGLDVLGFYYQRELADRADLRGTFYGGDLDLLDGTGGIGLPIRGNDKIEYGANVDFRWGGFHVFFQGGRQEIAELVRDGVEVEVLFRFSLPAKFATGGKQLFTFLQPVFRFSNLDNDFGPVPGFVAPSLFWDWKKYDFGVRMGIIQGVDLTLEYSTHDITASLPVEQDEFLTTLRFRF